MRLLGADDSAVWQRNGSGSTRIFFDRFFDRHIKRYVIADLRKWSSRWHYLAGRHYDWPHQEVLRRILKPGDTYVDIGANRGVHTLLATALVGRQGYVCSFEPNPETFQVLQAHLLINGIENCKALNLGLADAEGELNLTSDDDSSGRCSFRFGDTKAGKRVPVVRGDDILAALPIRSKLFVKIDTEGYEFHVLRGLEKCLTRENVLIYAEVTPSWLQQVGASAGALYQFMSGLGFTAFRVRRDQNLLTRRVSLQRLGDHFPAYQHEVLFVRPEQADIIASFPPSVTRQDSSE